MSTTFNAMTSRASTGSRHELLGRERERRELLALLARPDLTCLTLIGPGGVGKTRIAQQIARDASADSTEPFADGIWFVPLATVDDPQQVPPAILQVLGVELTDDPPAELLIGFLREREALLILDNLEQVIDCAPLVAAISADCRDVKIMATSRRPFRITGEQEYTLSP